MRNQFAALDVTDAIDLPGAQIAQRQERLELAMADGSRATISRDCTGSVVLRMDVQGQRVIVALPAEAVVRAGSHLAALGAAALEPETEEGVPV